VCAVLLSIGFFLFNKNVCKNYDVDIEGILFSNQEIKSMEQHPFSQIEDYKALENRETCLG
jgi:hypothetical protein